MTRERIVAGLNSLNGCVGCVSQDSAVAMIEGLIRQAESEAVAAEREWCARVCEATHAELDAEYSPEGCTDTALVAAGRIREGVTPPAPSTGPAAPPAR